MEIVDILNTIIPFLSTWLGTTIPRVVFAFLGLLVTFIAINRLWERKIRALAGIGGIAIGLLMVVASLNPSFLYILAQTSHIARVRFLMLSLSFVVMVITFEAIRRSHLQERYAILWLITSLIILVSAIFPAVLDLFRSILGIDYVTFVIGIIFTFLLLIAFHFSISLSKYFKNQAKIAQRCALLEEQISQLNHRIEESKEARPVLDGTELVHSQDLDSCFASEQVSYITPFRRFRGSKVVVVSLIVGLTITLLAIGGATPLPMVGDEVTHYYMLVKQAGDLSVPNFFAAIPTGWGEPDLRRYPHNFLWHYVGAIIYRLTGGSFFAVQLYHTLFVVQLLWIAYLIAKERKGVETRAALLYVLVVASLPVVIIFSITFYQDVPMSAQVLTAFYFLRQRRWLPATLFMCLAIGFKINALLFLPAFLFLMLVWEIGPDRRLSGLVRSLIAAFILGSFSMGMGAAIEQHAGGKFYPIAKFYGLIEGVKSYFIDSEGTSKKKLKATWKKKEKTEKIAKKHNKISRLQMEDNVNFPGSLQNPVNYLLYGGVILWVVMFGGGAAYVYGKVNAHGNRSYGRPPGYWLLGVGMSYLLLTAAFLHKTPDARFFLPGILFLLLPFTEHFVSLPRPKLLLAILSAIAVLQAGFVAAKVYNLRNVSPEVQEAITYLKTHKPTPPRVFMYPEGNYRLFPVPHEWYMNFHLREFWRSDNGSRIAMLQQFDVGAVVVKKHLIAEIKPEIVNLGVYPTGFVRDVRGDPRFVKVFENDGVVIFAVPSSREK